MSLLNNSSMYNSEFYPFKTTQFKGGVCNKVSNNQFPDCPALMDDGRAFTDYRSPCYINNVIRVTNNIQSSYDYRQFLQHNATELINTIRDYNIQKNGCSPCQNTPVKCETLCEINSDSVQCSPYDIQNGVGRCYQYQKVKDATNRV